MHLLKAPRTIACHHADGTATNIARVDAPQQYTDMIARLSSDASAHPSPPYRDAEDMWRDIPRQLARRARKSLGLPASSNVSLLSFLLVEMRAEAQKHLQTNIDAALISYPALPGLYDEAIGDAADYARINALTGYFLHQPRHTFAAYAGHGMGLCSHGGSYDECRDELLALPARDVLLVDCTSTAVLLHVQRIRAALDTADPDVTATADFVNNANNPGSPYEPHRLTASIKNLLGEYYRFRDRPTEMTVIISGDMGDRPHLQDLVAETVRRFRPEPRVFGDQALSIGARGAAQLAWRAVMGAQGLPPTDLK